MIPDTEAKLKLFKEQCRRAAPYLHFKSRPPNTKQTQVAWRQECSLLFETRKGMASAKSRLSCFTWAVAFVLNNSE